MPAPINILLLLDTQHIFDRKIFDGFQTTLRARGLNWRIETRALDQLHAADVANPQWNAVCANTDQPEIQHLVEQLNLPTLAICGQPQQFPSLNQCIQLMPDHQAICQLAMNQFTHNGINQLATFHGFTATPADWAQYRSETFANLAQELGYCAAPITSPAMLEQLKPQASLGVFCVSDKFARELTATAERLNIQVPEQISIIGVDNDPLEASFATKAMTTISFRPEQIGAEAVKQLAILVETSHPITNTLTIAPEGLHLGQTTGSIHADELVSRAIAYIRQNFHTGIKAEQVALHLNVSRSHLNQRFKHQCGQTVHGFLLLERLNFVVQQLEQSNTTIAEIAEQVGFASKNYLFQCFKKQYGISPSAYREQIRTSAKP